MQATRGHAHACSHAPQNTGGEGRTGKPRSFQDPQAQRARHTSPTPAASEAAVPSPLWQGPPPPPGTGRGWSSGCCPAPLTHPRAHTRSYSPPRRSQGERGCRAQAPGRPGSPVIPSQGETPPPTIPAGAKAVPSGSPGNTCSHFYQGMLTRQQQLHSESSRPRRRTARPLHLRPQETQVPGTRRRPPSLPGTRREAGTWEERGPTQREGAGVESPPPTQTCISSPSSGRRSGGGRGAGGEEGRRGRWRARRGGVELIGALSAGLL